MTAIDREIRVICKGYDCEWNPCALRHSYESILTAWEKAGLSPNRLSARAPTVGKDWGSFRHKRWRLEQTEFKNVERISLSHVSGKNSYPDRDWLAYASIVTWWRSVCLGWAPALIGAPAHIFFDLVKTIIDSGNAAYGYTNYRRPIVRIGFPPDSGPERELSMTASWWRPHSPEQAGSLLLRGVYPQNFLSRPYLDAPIGFTGRSLEEWINAAPEERGILELFTEHLVNWKPPLQNIPKIREDLYRAGRVFYWRFFCPAHHVPGGGERPEPLYRPDPRRPWEAPEPIPEIFRADYYKNIEMGVTYQLPIRQD